MDVSSLQDSVIELLFDCDRKNLAQVNNVLSELEIIIEHYNSSLQHSYMVDESLDDSHFENNFSPNGLSALQKHASPFLISIMRRPPVGVEDSRFARTFDS
jgi:hypothetical protein